jgi:hypothetical protein
MQNNHYHLSSKRIMAMNKLALFFIVLLSTACSQDYEITTWSAWCNHLNDHGLNKRYNLPKIRQDFVAGSRYFCESLFWASQPKQAAKT